MSGKSKGDAIKMVVCLLLLMARFDASVMGLMAVVLGGTSSAGGGAVLLFGGGWMYRRAGRSK